MLRSRVQAYGVDEASMAKPVKHIVRKTKSSEASLLVELGALRVPRFHGTIAGFRERVAQTVQTHPYVAGRLALG